MCYFLSDLFSKFFTTVKHETRIRTLETKNKEQEKQLMSQVTIYFNFQDFFSRISLMLSIIFVLQGIHLNNNGHSGEDLDPDEV